MEISAYASGNVEGTSSGGDPITVAISNRGAEHRCTPVGQGGALFDTYLRPND